MSRGACSATAQRALVASLFLVVCTGSSAFTTVSQHGLGFYFHHAGDMSDTAFLRLSAPTNVSEGNENSSEKKNAQQLRPGSLAAATAEQGRVPYGEASRKYRRTVFTHQDWVDHRSNERLTTNLKGLFFSGIVRQLMQEITLVASIAAAVVLWNDFVVPSSDGNLPFLALPSLPFTLSSPALGLLLVFRTNASYGRWLEARMTWGKIITQSRNVVRMAATFTDTSTPSGREALDHLIRATWVFPRSLVNRLSGPEDDGPFEEEVVAAFEDDDPTSFLPHLLSSPNRPVVALMELSLALDALPIDEKRRVEIDKSLVIMGDCLGACERIFTSPVPLVYTRHTARFLSLFMLLLPLTLYGIFEGTGVASPGLESFAVVPAAAVIALFLFGIEELAVQLEEPFSILPMHQFCDGIKQATASMQDWSLQSSNELDIAER